MKPLVRELLDFVSKRKFALGRLEAADHGTYEDWGEKEHPCIALLHDRSEATQLCRTILAEFFEFLRSSSACIPQSPGSLFTSPGSSLQVPSLLI